MGTYHLFRLSIDDILLNERGASHAVDEAEYLITFGKGKIVQALLGSRTREVLDARLDQLSTYGLLRDAGVSYLNELFRELQSAGLLVRSRQLPKG